MKKLLITVALLTSLYANAATVTVIIPTAGMTNMLGAFGGSAVVTGVLLTSPANNTASISLVDSVTNALSYINGSYSTMLPYATNLITSWVNFLGVTQYTTNLVIVQASNFVDSVTVSYGIPFQASVATNTTQNYTPLSAQFNNGVWVTNRGSGNATITLTYRE